MTAKPLGADDTEKTAWATAFKLGLEFGALRAERNYIWRHRTLTINGNTSVCSPRAKDRYDAIERRLKQIHTLFEKRMQHDASSS